MSMPLIWWVTGFALYLLASRLAMRRLTGGLREASMALLNIAGAYFFLFYGQSENYKIRFVFYLVTVLCQYASLVLFSKARGWLWWLAFFSPIVTLIVVRYVPGQFYVALGHALGKNWRGVPNMIGLSYLAFRCSRLVSEVRNGSVEKPGLCQYFSYALFLPTIPVGPINTYGNFRRGFAATPWVVPAGRAAMRILVGLVKYQFLSGVFSQVTYAGFLLNGRPHYWIDLPMVMVMYYIYLYCNFSGFCDMAIGAGGLIGIPVPENFDNPMAARNMKDFWNRWHITLSQWMRDIVFVPLSKYLVGVMGPARSNHAIAIAVTVVFLLVGIWHGTGWNFVLFGIAQGMGVVITHYYTIWLKKRLGPAGFKAYNANRWIHGMAVVLTFAYFSATTLLFAATVPQMKEIFQNLR